MEGEWVGASAGGSMDKALADRSPNPDPINPKFPNPTDPKFPNPTGPVAPVVEPTVFTLFQTLTLALV